MFQNIYHLLPPCETLNQQKWANHYWKLCNRAATRTLPQDTYTERHHTIPTCLGGPKQADHRLSVILTASEHYIAHQLLVKMYPGNYKLCYAARMMTFNGQYTQRSSNRMYSWLKEQVAKTAHLRPRPVQTKDSLARGIETKRKNNTLKSWTAESVAKMLKTKENNGTLRNSGTPEVIAKCLQTKMKNNTLNNTTPKSIAKQIETKIQNNTLNCRTAENVLKGIETKRKNGTLKNSGSPEAIAKRVNTRRTNKEFKNYVCLLIAYINLGNASSTRTPIGLDERIVLTNSLFTQLC